MSRCVVGEESRVRQLTGCLLNGDTTRVGVKLVSSVMGHAVAQPDTAVRDWEESVKFPSMFARKHNFVHVTHAPTGNRRRGGETPPSIRISGDAQDSLA